MVETGLRTVRARASSKVLITGAYLIIDPSNEGLVLSADARFCTTVKPLMLKIKTIRVVSPQFALRLDYRIKSQKDGSIRLIFPENSNTFIDKCVFYLV